MAETTATATFEPVAFSSLDGWTEDDHRAPFAAFLSSAKTILAGRTASTGLRQASRAALEASETALASGPAARSFFEDHFTAHRVLHGGRLGLLTGYYEPELAGSLQQTPEFHFPVLARPADLVNLVDEPQRGALSDRLTHARRTADGSIDPYFTRQEIEEGALDGRGLEIAYVADPVEFFFMQVQGSGLIRFENGGTKRLSYAGKNGHPYTSIGRHLIETGVFTDAAMNLQSLAEWLKADPHRSRPLLWRNQSYVFFRALGSEHQSQTLGANDIPLAPFRSLAVDTHFHNLGLPIYISAPTLFHVHAGPTGFQRLMVAHDVGSAIKGPMRGDLFCGSGAKAGAKAGLTKHAVNFFPLLPKKVLGT